MRTDLISCLIFVMHHNCHLGSASTSVPCACVCFFFLSGIRGWHRLGSVLSFGRLIYEHRPRQWRAAELLKGTTTKKEDRAALFHQRGLFVLKKLLNKRTPHCFTVVVTSYCSFILKLYNLRCNNS